MIVLNSPAGRDTPTASARPRRRAVVTMLAIASMSAACSGNTRDDSGPASVQQRRNVVEKQVNPNTPQRAPSQNAAATTQGTGEVPQEILAVFRDDLARRALVKPETITVVSATEQQWPDGSLGCPKPGEMYTQMIVPGYRVVLRAGGEKYAYHSDQRGNFVVCANNLALRPVKEQIKAPSAE